MTTNKVKLLGTLNATDFSADKMEVFNLDTLEKAQWVQSVNIQDGWIEQLVCICEDPLIFKTVVGPTRGDDIFVTQKVTGNWGVRRAEHFGSRAKDQSVCQEVALEQALQDIEKSPPA